MKPQLVEYEKLFKPKVVHEQPTVEYNYIKIMCNIFGLIFVCIGIYILYKRKMNKEYNKIIYQGKIQNLIKSMKLH